MCICAVLYCYTVPSPVVTLLSVTQRYTLVERVEGQLSAHALAKPIRGDQITGC